MKLQRFRFALWSLAHNNEATLPSRLPNQGDPFRIFARDEVHVKYSPRTPAGQADFGEKETADKRRPATSRREVRRFQAASAHPRAGREH